MDTTTNKAPVKPNCNNFFPFADCLNNRIKTAGKSTNTITKAVASSANCANGRCNIFIAVVINVPVSAVKPETYMVRSSLFLLFDVKKNSVSFWISFKPLGQNR